MELTMQSAKREIERLDRRIERLESQLSEFRLQREHLRGAIEYFTPKPTPKPKRRQPTIPVTADDVRGLGLEQALLFIAERCNGLVVSGPTREILIEAGILRGNPNTTSHALSKELRESPRFHQEARGRFLLIPEFEDAPDPEEDPPTEDVLGALTDEVHF